MDIARILHPVTLTVLAALVLAGCTQQSPAPADRPLKVELAGSTRVSAPAGDRMLLWGDTHVHTINSADAFSSGKAAADIDTAYRFAKGFPVVHPRTQTRIRIDRPLDFIVISDHAENLSVPIRVAHEDPALLANPTGHRLWELFKEKGARALSAAVMGLALPPDQARAQYDALNDPAVRQPAWNAEAAAADRYNEPGKFTAFVGWEWTSSPNIRNLHRVVMTDTDGVTARQFLPYNYYQSERPEDLWRFLEQTKARTGVDFLAMPHNSNLSEGLMFALTDSDGKPFTAQYARTRQAWEPVAEIAQYKGTSETDPTLSPNDEFAGFELRNALLTGRRSSRWPGPMSAPP